MDNAGVIALKAPAPERWAPIVTVAEALRIVQSLADGLDPTSGKPIDEDSVFQGGNVVRALYVAVKALERLEQRERRDSHLPAQAGKAWTVEEDEKLCEEFDSGLSVSELAEKHNRSSGAIRSRLQKLGKLTV